MVTVRSIFSLVGFKNWKQLQFDVKSAFLCGELDRELKVFMKQLEGLSTINFQIMYRLKKMLYDLKQAPQAWYDKVVQILLFYGFRVLLQILVCLSK